MGRFPEDPIYHLANLFGPRTALHLFIPTLNSMPPMRQRGAVGGIRSTTEAAGETGGAAAQPPAGLLFTRRSAQVRPCARHKGYQACGEDLVKTPISLPCVHVSAFVIHRKF